MLEKNQNVPAAGDAGWHSLFRGDNAIHSLVLCGGVALHALNVYIVTTTMPSIVRDIGGLDYYAWSTTLFVAGSILGAALSGRLLGRMGAGVAYAAGALVFGVGTLLCASAPDMPTLLAGRAVQGFGGGLLYALAYGVIRMVFPAALWSRAIGLISATWGAATLVGPAVGGVFAEFGIWRAAFWSLLPFTVLLAALALSTLPRTRSEPREPLPLKQLVLLLGIVLTLSVASARPTAGEQAAGVGAALVLFAGLIAIERRSIAKLLPRDALRPSSLLAALYATIALAMIGMQPEIFVPYFLQELHGRSPLAAGYIAALMALGWTAGSMTSAHWQGSRARKTIVAGPFFGLAGLLTIAVLMPLTTADFAAIALPLSLGIAAVGFGIGIAWPHIVTAVYAGAPAGEEEKASASITTVQLFAASLGAALAGMVANLAGIDEGTPEGTAAAANWLFWLFALAPALGIICARGAGRSAALAKEHTDRP
ncbi:MFS transporter [Sinorhizobium numidicum]|uniref:MFS transporter n=1 Tax=Sinorhizobium numidicum TaxID=680248 RepID=A0ABY8D0D0_9HYPH|nr:MFS transporter [Sinorhizobium numidicum]WEX77649.1 MFS transporter [Sinorhizobium numidicum]WEX84309.1 MFS transporter [Sinorhizobium numidicum]